MFMNFTITHVDHEFAGISIVPPSNNIVDGIIPSVAKSCRGHTSNLISAYSGLGGGIPEFDDDHVGLRSDTLRNASSHRSNCCAMSIVIRHVFRGQCVLIANERRSRESECVRNYIVVYSATCRCEFLVCGQYTGSDGKSTTMLTSWVDL